MKLAAVIRTLSPYSGPDQLLYTSPDPEDAEQFCASYIERLENNPQFDPWLRQAYREVDVRADTNVGFLECCETCAQSIPSSTFYLVVRDEEAFGQIFRTFLLVHSDRACAVRHAESVEEVGDADPVGALSAYVVEGVARFSVA